MKSLFKSGVAIFVSAVLFMCLVPVQRVNAAEFTSGTVSGNVYENSFFGYRVTLPAGYSFVGSDELAAVTGKTKDVLASEKEIVNSIEDGSVMTVAYAVDSSGSDSINVVISKVDPSDTENGMMTAARDALVPIFTDNGFSDVSIDVVNKTVAGESHDVLVINATIEGFNFYEQQMGAIKDGYSINITAANYGDDDTDTMLGNITKID